MMKAILFASVLAVTIPAGFFSPTPLDSLTMNLNIGDSPRGQEQGGGYPPVGYEEEDAMTTTPPTTTTRRHGLGGYPPVGYEEEDAMTTTPPTTDAREQEVLEKLMQGIKELKELDKSGKLSPQDNAGGEECGPKQAVNCGLFMTDAVAKCVALLKIKGPLDVYTCIKDALGIHQSKCMPCVCQILSIMGIPCPNPEMDEEEDAMTTTPPTTDAREQEGGKLSPQDYEWGDECGPLQVVNCATLLTATTAKCAFLLVVSGPPGVFACMQEALGPQSTCMTCICYFMEVLKIPCQKTEMGQKSFDYGGDATGYRGCYENSINPKLYDDNIIKLARTNSQIQCQNDCLSQFQYTQYIGLEQGYICRCGLEAPPKGSEIHRMVDNYLCEENPCPGDTSTKCGGTHYVKVFVLTGEEEDVASGPTRTTTAPTTGQEGQKEDESDDERGYVGCWLNKIPPIIFHEKTIELKDSNSRDECQFNCQKMYEGTTYIGLEHGYKCRCGNGREDLESDDYDDNNNNNDKNDQNHKKLNDNECEESQCPGDIATFCGGTDKIKIFHVHFSV